MFARQLFSERCLWKLTLAMYAYPLQRGVVSSIDKPECLAYVVCWCVGSDSFWKTPTLLQSNKRITANQITSHGTIIAGELSVGLPFRS